MKIMNRLSALIALTIFAWVSSACEPPFPQTFRATTEAMATYISITVVSNDPALAQEAIDAAFGEIRELEKTLSFWTEDSEVARINATAGKGTAVKVSLTTLEVVNLSLNVARTTDGAFDPTIGPLMRLWDYRSQKIPEAGKIAKALSLVDYTKVMVDPEASSVRLTDPMMSFDTGGIAKGYATDRAVAVLRRHGISSALVAVAGDIRAIGQRADGAPWRVGIRDPRSDSPEEIIAYIELTNKAVSTSGDYERYFIRDGKRYHHIIDPRTGHPVTGAMSVTIISDKSVLSDGYSTALFVQGPEKAMQSMQSLGLEGLIIDSDGRVHISAGLKKMIQWTSTTYPPH